MRKTLSQSKAKKQQQREASLKILGLLPREAADQTRLKKAYYKAMLAHRDSAEQCQKINFAYHFLSPNKKKKPLLAEAITAVVPTSIIASVASEAEMVIISMAR